MPKLWLLFFKNLLAPLIRLYSFKAYYRLLSIRRLLALA
ncbi:uncharacterized protein FFE2_08993 [Fusarium fujikuroi]|nr:uncharacterized protein FFE2_08993 [Fusarium fujikuroi]